LKAIGVILAAFGVLVGGVGTLWVATLHELCENDCGGLVPVWPFPIIFVGCVWLGIRTWTAGRQQS
jgi:hypothetical protein